MTKGTQIKLETIGFVFIYYVRVWAISIQILYIPDGRVKCEIVCGSVFCNQNKFILWTYSIFNVTDLDMNIIVIQNLFIVKYKWE